MSADRNVNAHRKLLDRVAAARWTQRLQAMFGRPREPAPRGVHDWNPHVLDHLLDGLISVDRTGCIRSFNAAAEDLFGYTAAEVLGRNLRLVLPESRARDGSSLLKDLAGSEASVLNKGKVVVRGRGKDGTIFPMRLSISGFDAGEDRCFLGLVCETQESRNGEDALEESRNRLRAIEQSLRELDDHTDEFLAVLGHELRNPLAPLSAGLELLQRTNFKPDVVKNVHAMMERQLAHLMRLVDDLLDVSRISRGVIELQRNGLDLRSVLESSVELVSPFIAERRHELVVNVCTDPLPVDGDFQRLIQAIGNLLSNAARYTEPGGTVTLRAEADGPQAVVTVADTGFGIPPERTGNLFKMFSQVPEHKARTGGGGLGIGLALAHRLVALHGGTIDVRSEGLGRGSEFVVRLPLVATPTSVRAPESDQADGATRRVLIVDDNRDAAETLRMVLELKGHSVDTAFDASSALQAAARIRPEVVLLDIGLPEMNGYEVAKRIRAMSFGHNVRLFALTGWGQEHDKEQARLAGFDEHLTKPVDVGVLSMLLNSAHSYRTEP